MNNATRVTVGVFGAVAALAGIEHGIGEVLQGNVAPGGVVIASWPDSALFRTLNGEPAMTLVPNLLASGILAILASLAFLAWATLFVQKKHGGLVLFSLSIVMLLLGGGFGPPLLGIILAVTASRIHGPLAWWRRHLSVGLQGTLGRIWLPSLVAGLVFWLLLCPGVPILGYFFGVDNPFLVLAAFLLAMGFLLLTIITGFAHDIQRQAERTSAAF